MTAPTDTGTAEDENTAPASPATRKRPGKRSAPGRPVPKIERLKARLGTRGGARIETLCELTGWQAHTVRAAISRLRKSGHAIDRATDAAGRTVYRTGRPGITRASGDDR